jgi:hypothetical protein
MISIYVFHASMPFPSSWKMYDIGVRNKDALSTCLSYQRLWKIRIKTKIVQLTTNSKLHYKSIEPTGVRLSPRRPAWVQRLEMVDNSSNLCKSSLGRFFRQRVVQKGLLFPE